MSEPKYLVIFRNPDSSVGWHAHRLFETWEAAHANAGLLGSYNTLEARICRLTVDAPKPSEGKRRHLYDIACQCRQCETAREFAMKEAAV